MDNIIHPEDNIAISRLHNMNEACNRLVGLQGVFNRLISSTDVLSDSDENDTNDIPTPSTPAPSTSDMRDETGESESVANLKEELNSMMSNLPSTSSGVNDKENSIDVSAPPSSPTPEISKQDIIIETHEKASEECPTGQEEMKNNVYDFLNLLDEIDIPEFDSEILENKNPKSVKPQELSKKVTTVPKSDDAFSVFDLSELITEIPEQCFDFSTMETDNPNLELDFNNLIKDSSLKSTDANVTVLPDLKSNQISTCVENASFNSLNMVNTTSTIDSVDFDQQEMLTSNYLDSKSDKIPSDVEMTSEDYFNMFIGSSPTKSVAIDKEKILLENDISSKSDKSHSDVEMPETASISGMSSSSSTKKSADLKATKVQDKTSKSKKKIPSSSKGSLSSTLPKNYTVNYSDKMAKFLGLDVEAPKKTVESEEQSSLSGKKNSTIDTDAKSDNNVEGRRRCTLNRKKCFEGYEKKPPRQDPEILKRNQHLIEAYHASLTDYETEMKNFKEPSRQKNCTVTSANATCIDLTGDEQSSETSTNYPLIDLTGDNVRPSETSSPKPRITKNIPTEFFKDFEPFTFPELKNKKQQSKKSTKVDDDEAAFRAQLDKRLEEKYKAMTFSENTTKLLKLAPQPEGCQLPMLTRLMSVLSGNKMGNLSTPARVNEVLNCELRRSAQEELSEKTEIHLAKFGHRKDIFIDKEKDMIISVELYHPVEKEYLAYDQKRTRGQPKLAMELQALSSNSLEELCNNFLCSNDYIGLKELPHPEYYSKSNLMNRDAAFEMLPTATMLINDTVYCFQDGKKGANTGKIIQEWEKSKISKGIGPLKYADLASTLLNDLDIQFGYPYVYVHLDSCEHIVIFTQARLTNPTDNQYANSYPIIKNRINFDNIYCKTHKSDDKLKNIKGRSTAQYLARYAVVDSDMFPDNPTLLCRFCVDKFCYDEKGKKRGSFKLYPFMQAVSAVKDK